MYRLSTLCLVLIFLCGCAAPTPMPSPTDLLPASTETPIPSPTFTPTETATEAATATEAVHARLGTMVLSPEYNLGGQLEIIQENQSAFYDNFLDSLIRVNREFFQALMTNDGVEVTDVASLKTYLEEHDWTVPAGIRIPIRSPRYELGVDLSEPLEKPLSLRNPELDFIALDQYHQALDSGDMHENFSFSPYVGPKIGFAIRLVFETREKNGVYTPALLIVHKTAYYGVGFPREGEALADSNVKALNDYMRFALYVMRTLQTDPPSELHKKLTDLHNPGGEYMVRDINSTTGIGCIRNTASYFSDFKQDAPSDSAPTIIKLK